MDKTDQYLFEFSFCFKNDIKSMCLITILKRSNMLNERFKYEKKQRN